MSYSTQKIDTYLNEYNIVVNKITSLSMKFASGSYFIPIGLFVGVSSLYIDSSSNLTNAIIIILPIILSFYIYNHIRYMVLQFKLSGYAKHLELKINELAEDNILLWENSIARSNNQNYFEAIFLGMIYILIFILMYYTAYMNLSNLIFENHAFYGVAFFVTMIYYYFFVFIVFFILSYINEHNNTFKAAVLEGNSNTFKKVTLLVNSQTSVTVKKNKLFFKLKELVNAKMYIIIVLFLLTPITFLPLIYLSTKNIVITENNYDYIIVLGNSSTDNEPSEDMKSRLDCLIDYIGDNQNCNIVLSGGNGEAALMSNYLENNNITNNTLILEETSQSTYQNLRNTKDLVSGNVLIITSDYHIFRTQLICNKLKLDYDFLTAKSNTNIFYKLIKECYAVFLEYFALSRN